MRRFFSIWQSLPVIVLFVCCSCAMLLQPTTSFDRRRIARSYGRILCQANPDCENCTDQFVVQEENGRIITLIVGYDGDVEILK